MGGIKGSKSTARLAKRRADFATIHGNRTGDKTDKKNESGMTFHEPGSRKK